jgi:hypothetical protein
MHNIDMKNKLKDIFFAITHPKMWIMLYAYDATLDKELNELVEAGEKFKPADGQPFDNGVVYDVTIGDLHLWVGNYPYGFFTQTDKSGFRGPRPSRPSRRTIFNLRKKVIKDIAEYGGKLV